MIDLLEPWDGPLGGLPPFDRAQAAAIEVAYRAAIDLKRVEVHLIGANPQPPTFANTVEALENSGRALMRVETLYRTFTSTMSTPEMRAVEDRLATLGPALDDEIAHDARLFARIEAVHASAADARLMPEQRRLVDVVRTRLMRRGAALTPAAQERLAAINARVSALQATFNQNLTAEQEAQAVIISDEADLDGLSVAFCATAAAAATARGHAGAWSIENVRPAVMEVLTLSTRRHVRERVWRIWNMRGNNPGPYDNKPVIAEILKLRGEKARLLGFANFAALATSERMAGTPDAALAQIHSVWNRVFEPTSAHLADLARLADQEGIRLAAWDRYFYAERLRKQQFGIDSAAVKAYLPLESIVRAIFWAAGRLYGLTFRELPDAPVYHADVRVFSVERDGAPLGAVWFDLFERPHKMRGSWQFQYRAAETFKGLVRPLASVNSNVPRGADEPTLLSWELARVLFHEAGHALHMLQCATSYPSLGSLAIPWDVIELPSLLNERWLEQRTLLQRFARHYETGEPMPDDMIDRLQQSTHAERVFSMTLDYLATAIVDMRIHLAADGSDVDAVRIEREVLAEIGLPDAVDPTLRVTHLFHSFTDLYAAGLYVYLWADVMAADVAEAFAQAADGYFDRETADRWVHTFLSAGNRVPAAEAFRAFRGRDPDPEALPRRFGLVSTTCKRP